MKYIKTLVSLVTAVSVAGSMPAFGADYTADPRGIVNFNETLDVSGLTGDYDKYLTYRVVDSNNKLQNFGQVVVDPAGTGNVNFSFRIKGQTGEYKLILSNAKLGKTTYTIDYVNNIYIEFNDTKVQNDIDLMDDFITSNGKLFGFDTDAYALLSDVEKDKIAQAFINAPDANSMDALITIGQSVDVVSALFKTADDATVLIGFITQNVAKTDSLFNKNIVKVFNNELASDADRIAIVSKIMGNPLNLAQMDIFEFEILKSFVGQIKYYEDMNKVILSEGNIWGFYATDLTNYGNCDQAGVQKDMRAAINSVENLGQYRSKFTEIIANNPTPSGSGSGSGSSSGSSGSSSGGSSGGGPSYTLTGENLPSNTADIKYDLPPIEKKVTFADLKGYEWAKEAIAALTDNYIINGVSENEFQPSRTIKREEFVKMITSGLRLTGAEATSTFADVKKDDWYYAAIAAAERAELITGNGDGKFGAGTEITRQDAAVLLSRTAAYKGVALESSVEISFTDNDSVADYAKSAVSKLSKAGIINGMEDGSFAPESALTRAEAAKMIYGLFKALSII